MLDSGIDMSSQWLPFRELSKGHGQFIDNLDLVNLRSFGGCGDQQK